MGNVIFDDLGIDYTQIMTEPEAFCKEVEDKALELREALKANNSVETYMKSLPEEKLDKKGHRPLFTQIYEYAENDLSVQVLEQFADELRKLAKQVEAIAYHKAVQALTSTTGVVDKQLLHNQYIRLRDSYNKIVDGFKALDIYKGASHLPPMPGNYGATVGLVHYAFYFEGDDEPYLNYLSVCRRLGIEPLSNLQDTIDYINAHPEHKVEVRKYTH